jgi:Ca2+-binding EF-hand superfamily protein
MISDFRKSKLERAFKRMDRNGDGVIERADCEQIARDIAAKLGWSDSSSDLEELITVFRMLWGSYWLPGDGDGDGKLSFEEYLAHQETLHAGDDAYDTFARTVGEPLWQALDIDPDGQVTANEFALFLGAQGVDEEAAKAAFAKLDSDGDGRLSREEFGRHHWAYFSSDDPADPGNSFFG